jgi:hypothetical protein
MASGYSPKLKFELIGSGEQAGLWGTTTNKNIGELIEQAIAGVTTVDLTGISGDYTLSSLDGTVDQARSAVISCSGAAAAAINIIIPTSTKLYVFRNACGKTITIKTAGQVGGVVLASGEANSVFCDGANALAGLVTAGSGTIPVSGGGTGNTSFTAGYLKSPGGTTQLTTAATIPATDISGQVGVANGGTGASSLASGGLLIGNGTGTVASLTGGVNGYVPTWNGSTWVSTAPSAAGVTYFNSRQGNVTLSSSDVTGALGYTPASTSQVNTVNPTFSSSVTSPTYYVGNTSNSIQLEGGGIGFTTSGLQANKFTSSGLGTNNVLATGTLGAGGLLATNFNLSVKGTIPGQSCAYFESYSGGSSCIGVNAYNSTYLLVLQYNNINVGSITTDGNTVSFNTSSDRRLKTDIQDLTDSGSVIDALQPRTFTWNVNGKAAKGFIADELQQIIPSAVVGQPDEVDQDGNPQYQAVDASTPEMMALIIAELQSLRKRVATAEIKIEAQATEIAALKGAK